MNAYELAEKAYSTATTKLDYQIALTMSELLKEIENQAKRIEELESHKELSDEEILEITKSITGDAYQRSHVYLLIARAIIKASRGEE